MGGHTHYQKPRIVNDTLYTRIKCWFGFHVWAEYSDAGLPYRQCIRHTCPKAQTYSRYLGEWGDV